MYQFLSFTHESIYFKIKEYKALNYSYKRLPQIIIFKKKKNRQTLSTLGKKKTLSRLSERRMSDQPVYEFAERWSRQVYGVLRLPSCQLCRFAMREGKRCDVVGPTTRKRPAQHGNAAKRETRCEPRRRRQRSRFGLKRNAGRLPDTVTGSTDEEIWRYRLLRAGVHRGDLEIWNLKNSLRQNIPNLEKSTIFLISISIFYAEILKRIFKKRNLSN